ncbi:NAD-dependent DNA ligase LigA [Candidatus Parcubacteria bacterium]|nr:NAD-dependent DNA ligase LigA [Candidatus Parcubacteria bacterium]
MDKKQTKERIEKLKKVIREARYSYHVLDKSIMSDAALDSLKHELFELEQKYPEFITQDSPSQRIGGKPLDKFKKVRHTVAQWSFNDVFDESELRNFDKRMKKELGTQEMNYTAELKIDGMHIILTYEKGVLKTGATRGDGKVGEDATQNLKTIESIPLRIKENIDVVVEGEIFMRKSVFEKLNKQRKERGQTSFANPRNAAAGAIRQLDSKIVKERKLDCFIYDYSWPEKDVPETQIQELKKLMELGFKVNKNFHYCKNIDEVIKFWKDWQKKRESKDFWIDGIVVKVNRREYQNKLGYTGKAPRWAIAFKWPGEQAATILEKVVFQIGRTGRLTPVACLKPVNIGGAVVSRATLHNADEIKRLGVKTGDTVIVEKAGDVIPHINRFLPALRPKDAKNIQTPGACPVCGSKVVRPKGEVAHYCSNKKCGARQRNKLSWFASKKAFDIEGLGPKIIDQLMDKGLVSNPADLFTLKKGDIIPLESLHRKKPKAFLRGFAEKSSSNLIQAIEKSRTITLPKFLISLGIKYIGEETAELLIRKIQDTRHKIQSINNLIDFFESKNQEYFEQIDGIGPKAATSIKNWFSQKENIQLLRDLFKAGVKIEKEKLVKSSKLTGRSFVFTGELKSMSRDKAKERIKESGGKTPNSISRNTDFLVVGKSPGSKYEKAKALGINIILEKEFLGMIK